MMSLLFKYILKFFIVLLVQLSAEYLRASGGALGFPALRARSEICVSTSAFFLRDVCSLHAYLCDTSAMPCISPLFSPFRPVQFVFTPLLSHPPDPT